MTKDITTIHNNDKLSPQQATTPDEVMRLNETKSTDNMELWALEHKAAYITLHSPFAKHKITLPKQEFDLMLEWYLESQEVIT